MTAIVELRDVTLVHDGKTVLDSISLSVAAGDLVALAGPSGSGKTSVLRVILGLVAPTRGAVRLRGVEASRDGRVLVPPEHRGLAMVFQDLALWPHLSVRGNLAFALGARHAPRSERARGIQAILADVGLEAFADRLPATLSGGERQRVAIARALVTAPDLVLLDEPLASLDVALREEIMTLLRRVLAERNAAALYATHDPREVRALGAPVIVIEAGRVVQTGTLDELAADPRSSFVRAFSAALA